jgi:putative modified peptide
MAGKPDTPLTPQLVEKLLEKLGHDDKFREVFEHDPEAAIRDLGFRGPFVAGACLRPTRLASKDEIRRSHAIIRDALLGQGHHEVFCLEAE